MGDSTSREKGNPCAICKNITPEAQAWSQYVCDHCRRASHALPGLLRAAKAVIEQWDTPNWKRTKPTGELINELRRAVAKTEETGG